MLYDRRQAAAKIESVEGTAETLAAADAKALISSSKMDFDPALLPRNPARSTFTQLGKLVGKRPGAYTMQLELRGSGTATTAPDWFKYLQACGTKVSSYYSINIGAVTSGPFTHGETITGGTSSATGRVMINTANGASAILFVAVGTVSFQSGEVLTGGTSGATATTSSTPTLTGKAVEPLTDSVPCLTIGSYEDGLRKLLKGSRGNAKLNLKSGEIVNIDLDYSGVEAGITDTALLTGIAYESTIPPVLLSASFSVDTVSLKIDAMSIDFGNELSPRDDINEARGILSFLISGRNPAGEFDPEMLAVATHDFYTKWFAGTPMVLDCSIGSVAGNRFRFYAPKIQYTKVSDESRNSIKTAKCSFDITGALTPGDIEWVLLSF